MKFSKLVILGLFLSSSAHAFISIGESAEVLAPNQYQIGAEAQIITNKSSGTNVNAYFDAPINESTSARMLLGGGSVDFNAFASVKWVPFPDVANQPAMGLRAGVGIARENSDNIFQAQIAPLVSKKFDTVYGLTTPYVALPLTFFNTPDENYVASNIAIGSEFHYVEWQNIVTLGAELGVDLNKSYSYVSVFATFPFESNKGFGK